MNAKHFLSVTALCMAMVSFGPANAQSLWSLITTCEEVSSEQEIDEANAALIALKNTQFVALDSFIQRGERCLTSALGVNITFIYGQGFLTAAERAEQEAAAAAAAERAEEEAAAAAAAERAEEEAVRERVCELRDLVRQNNMIISEAEAASQDRRIETLVATVRECSSWYDQSPREALTNNTCNSIFAAGGLPNSTISGPSQSEVLVAELSKQNAERELALVEDLGMLLEDALLQYGLEEEELDEEYQCNE